jgi:hypothetical protein
MGLVFMALIATFLAYLWHVLAWLTGAIGLYIGYQISSIVAIIVKLQSESGARNRTEGTRLWIQAKIHF